MLLRNSAMDALNRPILTAGMNTDMNGQGTTLVSGRVYELTGPRLVGFGDAVEEIAGASGRPVRFVPVTIEQFAATMREQSVPGDVVSLMTYLFTEVLDGRNAKLADGVQRALGREPRDFRDYARRTAATGIWDGGR